MMDSILIIIKHASILIAIKKHPLLIGEPAHFEAFHTCLASLTTTRKSTISRHKHSEALICLEIKQVAYRSPG